jgi:hypothetical protein
MEKGGKSRATQAPSDLARYWIHDDSMMQLGLSREVAGPRQQIEGAVTRHELRVARLPSMHCYLDMFSIKQRVAVSARCAAMRAFDNLQSQCHQMGSLLFLDGCLFLILRGLGLTRNNIQVSHALQPSLEFYPCTAAFIVQCSLSTSVWRCIGRGAFAVSILRNTPPSP